MNFRNHPIVIGILIILAAGLAWYFRNICIYLVISIVLSLVCQPLVRLYSRITIGKHQLPRFVIALMVLVTLFLLMAVGVSTFIPLMVEEAKIISSLTSEQVMRSFSKPIANIEAMFSTFQPDAGKAGGFQVYAQEKITALLSFTRVSEILNSFAKLTGDLLAAFFSILFMTFFFLKDEHLVSEIIVTLTPSRHEEKIKRILDDARRMLTKYFLGLCLQAVIVITLLSAGLSIFGVKNALTIAFFAGIINVIPYIGPLIGTMFGILIGVSTSIGMEFYAEILPIVLKISGVFVVVYLLDSVLVSPLIFSNIVKAHPLEIFIVILVAGKLADVQGMIAAIPAYTIIRIIAREFFNQFRIVQKITEDIEN